VNGAQRGGAGVNGQAEQSVLAARCQSARPAPRPPLSQQPRSLMTICELGKEWEDPVKIPVSEIVDEWRVQSSRGRYESAMWRAAGLEEPSAKGSKGGTSSAADDEDMAAHGEEHAAYRTRMGWAPGEYRPAPRVIPAAAPAAAAAATAAAAAPATSP